jgi:heme exporter protein D
VGTIEVVVSKEAQVALLREVERERRRVKRLKRQSDREAAHVA